MCPFSPGVYLDSAEPQLPSLPKAEPSQPEEAELGFWPVRPGGGLEGAATDSALGGRGTFHSSWAREELDTEPLPGDHLDSLGLAVRREEERGEMFPMSPLHFKTEHLSTTLLSSGPDLEMAK